MSWVQVKVLGVAQTAPQPDRSPDAVYLGGIVLQDVPRLPPDAVVLVEVSKATALMHPCAHFYGTHAHGRIMLPSGRPMTAADVAAVQGRVLPNVLLQLCQPNGVGLPARLPLWGPTGTTVRVPVDRVLYDALVPGARVHLAPRGRRYEQIAEQELGGASVTLEVQSKAFVHNLASYGRRFCVVTGVRLQQLVAATPLCRAVGQAVPPELARTGSDVAPPGIASSQTVIRLNHPLLTGHDFEVGGARVRALGPAPEGGWRVAQLLHQQRSGNLRRPLAP